MRASGILMPVFSLPGPYGIGTLGNEAFAFVDFLAAAKQTYWQILPIGPTGYGDSPYQSFSAFAGNPYFIDFRLLAADGLLTEAELPAPQAVGPVDYGALYQQRPVVFALGMVIHWLPDNWKRRYRIGFARMPLPLMAAVVVLTVFIAYQFVTAEMQPFIYFQF